MSQLLNLQITIFLLLAVGCWMRRSGTVSREGQRSITDIVIQIILPCNIVNAFCVELPSGTGRDFLYIFLLSVLVQCISVFYGKFVFRKEAENRQKSLRYGTICSNAGFLGNPVAEGLFGAYGLLLASFFLIPQRIMMWTEGIAIFSGIRDRKSAMKKAATHPCILACWIGIFLLVTGLRFPEPISKTIRYLASCNTAFSMMIVGMVLGNIQWNDIWDWAAFRYCIHRLLVLPLVIYGITACLPLSPMVRSVTVLLTAMPAGATTSILAAKYDVEPEFATKLVVLSTLFSLPSLVLWNILLVRPV